MEIAASYEAMSDVPTGYETLYTDTDGKAVFTGGGIRTDAEYNELNVKKQSAFTDMHTAKDALKVFDGIDATQYRAMQDKISLLEASGTDSIEKTIADRLSARDAEFGAEKATMSDQIAELTKYKLSHEEDAAIGSVLDKYVSKDAQDARTIIGLASERGPDGVYTSNGALGFPKGLPLETLVLKAMETRPEWKKASTPGHGGSGASGNGDLDKDNKPKTMLELVQESHAK